MDPSRQPEFERRACRPDLDNPEPRGIEKVAPASPHVEMQVRAVEQAAVVGGKAAGQEEDVQPGRPLTWQVAAGRRLWLIDPTTGDLRTCAVRNTSTVGVEAIRCFAVSGSQSLTHRPD